MRRTMLIAAVLVFLACWVSSCALHRHRIESSDHHSRYWSHHGGGWYKQACNFFLQLYLLKLKDHTMKRSLLIILAVTSVIFSSCYARVRTYNDGYEMYRWHRPHYDRHFYQRDRDYHYKDSYYHNHRDGNSFRSQISNS